MGKEIQHKKIKNTGILFEVLTRQLTSDVLNGNEKSAAKELIQKHFGSKTELGKEYLLYQSLAKQKFDSENKSLAFIDEVIAAHSRLNKSELRKEKYNLIKEIKECYAIDDLFKNRIDNYKLLASIYKLFQSKSVGDNYSPAEIVESKFTILEHISKKTENAAAASSTNTVIGEYGKLNEDVRLLAYKIMVDKFNEKYKVLNEGQRNLIKEYINNISSANSLRNYILQQLESIKVELKTLVGGVSNQVSKIKVHEVINQLQGINEDTAITDNHVMAMLTIYELIDELKKAPAEAVEQTSEKPVVKEIAKAGPNDKKVATAIIKGKPYDLFPPDIRPEVDMGEAGISREWKLYQNGKEVGKLVDWGEKNGYGVFIGLQQPDIKRFELKSSDVKIVKTQQEIINA